MGPIPAFSINIPSTRSGATGAIPSECDVTTGSYLTAEEALQDTEPVTQVVNKKRKHTHAVQPPVANYGSGEVPENHTAVRVKQEVAAKSTEVINLADDDDEESVAESIASTKDDYKDLCEQLSLK